jgi:hypothetical protein
MAPPPDFSSLSSADKDALIRALLARVDALIAENAALRERLNLPAKTPDNSSTPPSQGTRPVARARRSRRPRPMLAPTGRYIRTRRGGATSWPITASIVAPM